MLVGWLHCYQLTPTDQPAAERLSRKLGLNVDLRKPFVLCRFGHQILLTPWMFSLIFLLNWEKNNIDWLTSFLCCGGRVRKLVTFPLNSASVIMISCRAIKISKVRTGFAFFSPPTKKQHPCCRWCFSLPYSRFCNSPVGKAFHVPFFLLLGCFLVDSLGGI